MTIGDDDHFNGASFQNRVPNYIIGLKTKKAPHPEGSFSRWGIASFEGVALQRTRWPER